MDDSDLILDFEETEKEHDLATQGQRFANYIIDTIATSIVMMFLGVGLAIGEDLSGFSGNSYETFGPTIVGYGFSLIYFALFEFFTGKTLGKFITKTKVLTAYGEKPSFMKILGRTLCRFIPFEAFSFLFGNNQTGWHDTISDTIVVQD